MSPSPPAEAIDRNSVILATAHCLSTVENADRINTMEDGRIFEGVPTVDW